MDTTRVGTLSSARFSTQSLEQQHQNLRKSPETAMGHLALLGGSEPSLLGPSRSVVITTLLC